MSFSKDANVFEVWQCFYTVVWMDWMNDFSVTDFFVTVFF